jgi:hypothetical protein
MTYRKKTTTLIAGHIQTDLLILTYCLYAAN